MDPHSDDLVGREMAHPSAMLSPVVCVLIRTVGRPTLLEAVRSALSQTWPALRVKVVLANDQPLQRLAAEFLDPRVEILHGGQRLARAAAANCALDAVDSDLALFLDDDDWLLPGHVERLVQALQSWPEAVAAHAGVECLKVSSGGTEVVHVFDSDISLADMQLMNRLPIHATVFRMSAVRRSPALRFNEALDCFEDWDFWLQLLARGEFIRVPGISAVYRLDDEAGSGHAVTSSAFRQQMLERFGAVQLGRWTPKHVAGLIEHESALAYAQLQEHKRANRLQLELDVQSKIAEGLRVDVDASRRQLADLQQQLANLAGEHRRLDGEHRRLETNHQTLEAGYLGVTGSLSWRVTTPLRSLRSLIRPGMVRGLAKAALGALPISVSSKRRARAWLSTTAAGPRLLGWLATAPAAAASSAPPAAILDKEVVRAEAEAELSVFLGSTQRLNLRCGTGKPQVTVVVVLYNQAGLSLLCLRALSDSVDVSFETIIVDNASSDRMPQLLERLDGARILRQESNLGFLRAVNLAAEQATGEHLLLLNNDAVVEPQTLATAVARLAAEADVGAVGGPILLWDGRLQEAGSIIWRDGSCLGYGRGDSPDAPAYRFVRDVDYCSGAFLMVRRALFDQLGRFDEAFAPAYYEETDFSVRLWVAGHRIVYDPKVRVKHFEFASDTGGGTAMTLQARNRERFVAKHGPYLQRRPEADPDGMVQARQILRPGARRVLIIDDRVPLPDLGRGYPRAAMVATTIADEHHALTYYPLQVAGGRWDEVYAALNPRTEVMLDMGIAGLPKFLSQRAGQFDLILVSRPHNMQHVAALRASNPAWFKGAKIVYDAEALFCLRTIEQAKVLGRPLPEAKAKALLKEELSLADGADRIVAVSLDEARHFREAGCPDVVVLGHALAPQVSVARFEQRSGFLFVGAITLDDCPNGDSVRWFVREVWPLIQAALGPSAQLDVVGVCESAAVRALDSPTIRVHGRVADLAPHFESSRVFIVPTRYAAGVPHKAHEAASRGLPMVVTPLIARQLGWQDEVLVADGAQAFAQACIRLHSEPATWQSLRDLSLAAVERDCSAQAFQQAVQGIVQ